MSRNIYPLFIKGIAYVGTGYLVIEIYKSMMYEKEIKKLRALKEHHIKQGLSDELEQQPEMKKLQEYQDNHYGQRLLEQMQTTHVLEEQLKITLDDKKQLRNRIAEINPDKDAQQKIDKEIEQLNDLFTQIRPSKKRID